MKKDIQIPISKDIFLAIVPQEEGVFQINLLNCKQISIRNILITTSAYDDKGQVTSTLRYFIEALSELSAKPFETLMDEVFEMKNEVFLSYYIADDLYELNFTFDKRSMTDLEEIPLLLKPGYLLV
ncbi:MAG: hypothetical protein MUE53_02520 [Chitinophagales bacterium]|jgi:hypothetical protein|nr:hypothetical protein [Chitinophagales bacterium]